MTTVYRWTGREAKLLREALRLSIRDFADRLGVAARTVNKWEARLAGITPLPHMQEILDTALARACDDVKARFAAATRTEPPQREAAHPAQPGSPSACAALAQGALVPLVVNGHLVLVRITADTLTALGLDAASAQSGTAADPAEDVPDNPLGSPAHDRRGKPGTPSR